MISSISSDLCFRTYSSIKEPHNDKTNKMTCAPSEDSDQPGHPPEEALGPCLPYGAHSEDSDQTGHPDSDQTGRMPRLICLRWAHTHFVGFVMSRLSYLG